MDVGLTPRVTSVTVYTEQARVTASGQVTLPAGNHRLVVDDLPLTMDKDSLRVDGQGEARVRLLGVDVRRQHFEKTPAEKIRELEEEVEKLQDDLQALADEKAVMDAQVRYIEGLRGESEQYARGLALGRTKVAEQEKISRFFQEQDKELRASKRDLEKQTRALSKTLDKTRRELDELRSGRPAQRNQAIVDLEVLSAGNFEAEVVYNVRQASWKPIYDVRLLETEGGNILVIEGIAQITQSSGQDWADVKLKVSTARIGLNRRLPKLKPWYIDVYQPPMPRATPARVMAAAAEPEAMAMDAQAVAEAPVAAQIAKADVHIEEGGATITYDVAGRGNVPSDGSPHKSTLFRSSLPAKVDYVSVPKHTEAVFRRTKGANNGPSPFLAGQVHLFVGQRFIGVSHIEYVPVGDEIELLVGVEERLTVERKMIRRDVDKRRLRDRRQIQYGYEIEIKNLLHVKAQIEVQDNVPVARHEEISIKLVKVSPEPSAEKELNLMEWRLDVAAGATEKIKYEYQVEHPRTLQIVGLVD
ncbi:MAG: mucoidy inhibitor MuiA family protein [Chloroflexota bacterium]|nr:MAG: mucoidy inhibitor MuiA family protein [Chloroflexota bacterium]